MPTWSILVICGFFIISFLYHKNEHSRFKTKSLFGETGYRREELELEGEELELGGGNLCVKDRGKESKMFILRNRILAILKKTRRGREERFTATLNQTGESRGTDQPRWRWSDFYIDGGGESYTVSKRQYKTQEAACKALLKAWPKATIEIE